jgi:predicted RNA methylase
VRQLLIRCFLAFIAALLLTACQTTGPASVKGECQAFTNPGFAIQGKRRMDQQAVDRFLETGIVTCGWPRPKQ